MINSKLNLVLLLSCLALAPSGFGAVGYYNLTIYPGDNLVANQLEAHDNTLNGLFNSSTIADGSTFTKWDASGNSFQPASIYNASSHLWSINYTLNLTEGGLFHSSVRTTNTFIGEVNENYYNLFTGTWHYENYPDYADGLHLISCPVPINGASFLNVVGRGPADGEWVMTLNPSSQTYVTTTFNAASGTWDNGAPALGVGAAAWFNLGPVAVPEPSASALAFLGVMTMIISQRGKKVRFLRAGK